MGLVPALMLPLVSWLLDTQGWRTTSLIWGGVVFAGIPLTIYIVRQKRPEYYGLLPDGAKVDVFTEVDKKIITKGARAIRQIVKLASTGC